MGCLGVLLIGLGVVFLFYGVAAFWFPPVAILFLIPGILLVLFGRQVRRKARQNRLRREMGDRW